MTDFVRGERLRSLREARHLSQEAVAFELRVSTKSVRAWEHGGKIRWKNAKALAAFYGVDPEGLVTREELDGDAPDVLGVLGSPDQLARIEGKLDQLLAGDYWQRAARALDELERAVSQLDAEAGRRRQEPGSNPGHRPAPARG